MTSLPTQACTAPGMLRGGWSRHRQRHMKPCQSGYDQRKSSTGNSSYCIRSSCRRPNQLFMPHINILDYVIWPAFREFAVQIPQMHEHMAYMMDISTNISCEWRFGHEEALCRNANTGMLDLCEMAKVSGCHWAQTQTTATESTTSC